MSVGKVLSLCFSISSRCCKSAVGVQVTNLMDYRGSSNMDCWGSIKFS